jgi:hypothetical protein
MLEARTALHHDSYHDNDMNWKHILAGICGFTFGFWLCMPRDILLLPRYEVLVTDAAGKGFPAVEVHQFRQDNAITGAASSSFATADTYGRAAFPSVGGHTSPLLRLIECGRLLKARGLQTPCGYHHQITVDLPDYTESTRTETDLPLKNRGHLLSIVLRAD